MLKNRKWLSAVAGTGLVALLAAPAISGNSPFTARVTDNRLLVTQTGEHGSAVETAAVQFISARSDRDIETVWLFASEEEQDAFATEEATYEAYADTFPALTKASALTVQRTWSEGDTPFVELTMVSGDHPYRVTMGLWLDDANDWKVVSCDVAELSDRVAGL